MVNNSIWFSFYLLLFLKPPVAVNLIILPSAKFWHCIRKLNWKTWYVNMKTRQHVIVIMISFYETTITKEVIVWRQKSGCYVMWISSNQIIQHIVLDAIPVKNNPFNFIDRVLINHEYVTKILVNHKPIAIRHHFIDIHFQWHTISQWNVTNQLIWHQFLPWFVQSIVSYAYMLCILFE